MVPRPLPAATLVFLLVAGCLGGPVGSTESSGGEPTAATATTTDSPKSESKPPASADQPAHGTQFVSVEQYENHSTGATWPPEERSTFENLTDARRKAFLRALEDGQQRYGPDESNPFDYHDDERPRVVNYEGDWYFVRVAIV